MFILFYSTQKLECFFLFRVSGTVRACVVTGFQAKKVGWPDDFHIPVQNFYFFGRQMSSFFVQLSAATIYQIFIKILRTENQTYVPERISRHAGGIVFAGSFAGVEFN